MDAADGPDAVVHIYPHTDSRPWFGGSREGSARLKMAGFRNPPIVVRMRDEVTGTLSIVPVDEIGTVLEVWFPLIGSEERQAIADLRVSIAADDWVAVEGHARALGLQVEPFLGHGVMPSPRRSGGDQVERIDEKHA